MWLEDCLWEAPDFISSQFVLSRSYTGNNFVKTLFTNILEMRNWTIDDIIAEMEYRRDNNEVDVDLPLVRNVYAFIQSNVTGDDAWKSLRQVI